MPNGTPSRSLRRGCLGSVRALIFDAKTYLTSASQ
jgi:hypothetical protein